MLGNKKKNMSEHEKMAKMGVLKDLMAQADDSMFGKIKGLKKVTVASNTPEGLEHGLDKAKHMAEKMPHAEPNPDMLEGEDEAEEAMESPEEEKAEDAVMDPNADSDTKKGKELQAMIEGAKPQHDMAENESPEDLDAKIQELLKRKESLGKKKV